jgi:hypothetical protein
MASSTCFRFLDLPAEVRYIIYREILCSFTFEDNSLARLLHLPCADTDLNQAIRPYHSPILRVNHEVHREAYDVMIKTNRFIYVSSTRFSSDLEFLLRRFQGPFMTTNRAQAQQFQDYMMYVYVDSTRAGLVKQSRGDFVGKCCSYSYCSMCMEC